jgi:ABC-type proline/glycine betaine transport system permease subunit
MLLVWVVAAVLGVGGIGWTVHEANNALDKVDANRAGLKKAAITILDRIVILGVVYAVAMAGTRNSFRRGR